MYDRLPDITAPGPIPLWNILLNQLLNSCSWNRHQLRRWITVMKQYDTFRREVFEAVQYIPNSLFIRVQAIHKANIDSIGRKKCLMVLKEFVARHPEQPLDFDS